MHMHANQFKTVSTPSLSNGDVIQNHGAIFRLRDRKEYADDTNMGGGNVVVFHVDVLEEGDDIPKHWLNDFTIQGNNRAMWALVTDDALLQKYAA